MPMHEIVAEVYRAETVESVHYGSLVVVDNNGKVLYYAGDPDLLIYTRSALKPFQAVPLVEKGGLEKFGFSLKSLAIMCGSHAGTELHVKQVQENLDKIGLDESYLYCGTHPPIYYTAQNILPRRDEIFTPIQHNCSGKHSGLLALSLLLGDDPGKYMRQDSETQKVVFQAVADICEISIEDTL